mgnify:CR=1 FL=1
MNPSQKININIAFIGLGEKYVLINQKIPEVFNINEGFEVFFLYVELDIAGIVFY